VVRFVVDVPEAGIRRGALSTAIDLLGGAGQTYEIEVVNDNGQTEFLGPVAAGAIENGQARSRTKRRPSGRLGEE
jgi:hypothetical protein